MYSSILGPQDCHKVPRVLASELRNPTKGLGRTLETSIRNLVKINENDGWAFSNPVSAETVAVVSRLMLQKNTAGGRAA